MTPEQAHAWLAAQVEPDTARRCDFCRAGSGDAKRFVVVEGASICEACIGQFHRALHSPDTTDASGTALPAGDNPA